MVKKIFCILTMIMLCIGFLPACEQKGKTEETVAGDFSLTLTVNKTRVA